MQEQDKVALARAIQLSATLHKHQRDKSDMPYILHPLRVMFAVAPDLKAMQVAVLHDLIEDCNMTQQALLIDGEFSLEVIEAVVAVSREPKGHREWLKKHRPNWDWRNPVKIWIR